MKIDFKNCTEALVNRKSAGTFLLILLSLIFLNAAHAGRPVVKELTRDQIIAQSDFIFTGWPSPQPANASKQKCPAELGRWQVHKVYKGDQSLTGKIISIADHRYEMFLQQKENSKGPSYAASTYKSGTINREQSSSVMFTNRKKDGCFELSANGAQEHHFKEAEIEALTANPPDCEKASHGFETRLRTLPKDCKETSDCKIFHINPDTLYESPVLSKKAEAMLDDEFKALQANLKVACAKDWADRPVESPYEYPVRCENNVCKKGVELKVIKTPVTFTTATMADGCAPHDALSKMITLKTGVAPYPVLSINWWGKTNSVKTTGDKAYEAGLQVNFCNAFRTCPSLKTINLQWKGEVLEYDVETTEGQKIKGAVKVQKVQGGRVMCG